MKHFNQDGLIIDPHILYNDHYIFDYVKGQLWSRKKNRWIKGSYQSKGYLVVDLPKPGTLIHRLLYESFYGYKLTSQDTIDHRNRIRDDNSIKNLTLRDATGNAQNRCVRYDNSTGVKGVQRTKSGKYKASITINGNRKYLGAFKTLKAACKARIFWENFANQQGGAFNPDGNIIFEVTIQRKPSEVLNQYAKISLQPTNNTEKTKNQKRTSAIQTISKFK